MCFLLISTLITHQFWVNISTHCCPTCQRRVLVRWCLFGRSFVHSFIRSSIHSFVCLFVHRSSPGSSSFVRHSFVHRLFVCSSFVHRSLFIVRLVHYLFIARSEFVVRSYAHSFFHSSFIVVRLFIVCSFIIAAPFAPPPLCSIATSCRC